MNWPVLKSSVAGEISSMLSTVVGRAPRPRADPRRVRGRQDRHDRELRRRLVRRLDDEITVAVWVGYPDELARWRPSSTASRSPAARIPAAIWKTFVEAARRYQEYGRRRTRRRTTPPSRRDARAAGPDRAARPTDARAREPRTRPERQAGARAGAARRRSTPTAGRRRRPPAPAAARAAAAGDGRRRRRPRPPASGAPQPGAATAATRSATRPRRTATAARPPW